MSLMPHIRFSGNDLVMRGTDGKERTFPVNLSRTSQSAHDQFMKDMMDPEIQLLLYQYILSRPDLLMTPEELKAAEARYDLEHSNT